jgi:delta-lactam-biosynthetic de-N-acetylase
MGRDRLQYVRALLIAAVVFFLATGDFGCTELFAWEEIHHGRGRTVALTFDDGPEAGFSDRILDILKRYDVKASFFVVGRFAAVEPDCIRRMIAEGHIVANHSHYHNNITKLPPENAHLEWDMCQETIRTITGTYPVFCRPPGGQYNEFVLELAAKRGLVPVFWTVNPGDYRAKDSAPELARKVVGQIHPGAIVLLHIGVQPTVEALPAIIEGIRKKGYSFVTVDQLPRRETARVPHTAGKGQ